MKRGKPLKRTPLRSVSKKKAAEIAEQKARSGAGAPLKKRPTRKPAKGAGKKKQISIATLDRLHSLYIRREGVCEFAGQDGVSCSPQLQCMHGKSRRYMCTRFEVKNTWSGCAAHHRFYHNNPDLFIRTIDKLWPGRWDEVQAIWLKGEKIDREKIAAWLRAELAKLR